MRVRDLMTSPAITLRPHVPVPLAAARLAEHGFTGAPVVDAEGRLLGVVTEADLLRGRIAPDGEVAAHAASATVREVMTVPPRVTDPSADVAGVVASMLAAGVRMLPVVEGELLVGVLTRRDALRAVTTSDPPLVRPGVPGRTAAPGVET